jgi:hypothetical protein
MSLAVEYDRDRRWVLVRVREQLTLQEVLSLITSVRAQHEYRMWPMLCDAQEATTAMTERDVDVAVEAVRHALTMQGPRAHVAIAASDDVLYARLLLYETRLRRDRRHYDPHLPTATGCRAVVRDSVVGAEFQMKRQGFQMRSSIFEDVRVVSQSD